MNRFPVWKNVLIVLVVLAAALFASPNLFLQSPAVQIIPARAELKVDQQSLAQATDALDKAGIKPTGSLLDDNGLRVLFDDTNVQLRAQDVLAKSFGSNYVVALNLISQAPGWLKAVGASPMFLGLDLRGGVHFLLQVDNKAVVTQALDHGISEMKLLMKDKNVYPQSATHDTTTIAMHFRDADAKARGRDAVSSLRSQWVFSDSAGDPTGLNATLQPDALKQSEDEAVAQNILIMRNRINELGVAEPIIQRQGDDRIIVELPGVQDTAKAKEVLGRTASLEIRMVAENATTPGLTQELTHTRDGQPVIVQRQAILTGRNIVDAKAGFDQRDNRPTINLTFDSVGAHIFDQVTRDNVGKRMAILQIEKGQSVALNVARIIEEIPAGQVQITGIPSTQEATETALLVRAGALAAPMEIIEERTLGPSLGKDNIDRGIHAVEFGFIAIAIFMSIYYRVFGLISVFALAINLVLLIAVLSIFQATLTLPGMAGIALTVGMAIDANVLINERIREELRQNRTPQVAIRTGYDLAFATILDSNVTTFIVGVALFAFGSGPVRGFAFVLCLGILTSMFSAVMVSRASVNFLFGSRRKLTSLPV